MSVRTTCRLADPIGNHLIEIANYTALDYILNCSPGGIGVLELTLPATFDTTLLMRDGRIGAWRSINGAPPYLDGQAIFLIERIEYANDYTKVSAYHASTLLFRRIIAYNAGTTYTNKAAAAADDQIKAFVDENMLAGIVGASRDGVSTQEDVSAYLTKQANLTLGASVAMAATRRNLGEVVKDLCDASTTAGTYLTAEIMAPTESTLELRTYTTQRGVDHRASSSQPVILSESRGNLEKAVLIVDYSNECTMAIAGGQGEGDNRLIATTFDAARAGLSPFGRIERFIDASNVSSATTLQYNADAAVRDGRPVTMITGEQIDTPATTRGIHFDLGDMVTVEHPRTRQQVDVRLDVVHEHVDASGRQQGLQLTGHQVQHRRTLMALRSVT